MSRAAKKARAINRLLLCTFAVLAAVFLGALVMLIVTLTRYKQSADLSREAAEFVSTPVAAETPTPSPVQEEDDAVYANEQAATAPVQTPPVSVDFETLTAKNPNIAAWLYSADTPINYPVMRTDDNEYYLTHAFNGEKSVGGALFFDVRTDTELAADNLIIYGHHMKDRSMFGTLKWYRDEDYYRAHPVLYLLTPGGNYRVEVFSARTCPSEPDYYPVYFQTDAARSEYVRDAIDDSRLSVSAEAQAYRLVTLVTCSYNGQDDDKYLIHGWLVPI